MTIVTWFRLYLGHWTHGLAVAWQHATNGQMNGRPRRMVDIKQINKRTCSSRSRDPADHRTEHPGRIHVGRVLRTVRQCGCAIVNQEMFVENRPDVSLALLRAQLGDIFTGQIGQLED